MSNNVYPVKATLMVPGLATLTVWFDWIDLGDPPFALPRPPVKTIHRIASSGLQAHGLGRPTLGRTRQLDTQHGWFCLKPQANQFQRLYQAFVDVGPGELPVYRMIRCAIGCDFPAYAGNNMGSGIHCSASGIVFSNVQLLGQVGANSSDQGWSVFRFGRWHSC